MPFLPDVLIDNFDIVNFDKSADRFDIYLDEKKVQLKEDKTNPDIISYGFGEYEEYWSMDESLNQPSSVKDDCPMGCKLLLYGNKVRG